MSSWNGAYWSRNYEFKATKWEEKIRLFKYFWNEPFTYWYLPVQLNWDEFDIIKENVGVSNNIKGNTSIDAWQVSISHNKKQDWLEINFWKKPSSDVISSLKSNGFRWSMRNKVWYKKGYSEDRYNDIAGKLKGLWFIIK